MGDPAEDLAYLAELNALPDAVLAGGARGLRPRGDGRGRGRLAGRRRARRRRLVPRQGMEDEARPLLERGASLTAMRPAPPGAFVHRENPGAQLSYTWLKPPEGRSLA